MKTNGNNKHPLSNASASQKRPNNKDKIDSREGEEQRFKGDDVTHNHKEVHNKPGRHKK